MNSIPLMPLAGLALWLAAIYIDSKFKFQPPSDKDVISTEGAVWWTRVVVRYNHSVKYGALFALWLFIGTDVYFRQISSTSSLHYLLVALSGVSIAVYVLAQSWRFLIKKN